ncbi:SRPBCC domain-containing protein [Paenibacillus athensensis]|uniref:Polyketide cyclase n=1 Tax=Paenibacillus athensensis TaxID=1967502 RepID=A0A4Y8PWT7_9BACL|nr:SRPBCC domain-containing protein [Paenibacillus athensensis]MCD1261485.1 SRPBCC domain-containing protein [Paenibacillus athensensis]
MDQSSTQTLPDIRQTQLLNAPIQKVWAAVSTAEGISAWFMPNDFQPVVGQEFHIKAGPWGDSLCKVTVFDPPHKLAFTWGKDWTLAFELEEVDGKTQFTLVHSGWDTNKVTEFGEAHAIVRERMAGGWAGIGAKLASVVEG